MRGSDKLTPLKIARLTKPGRYGDGGGLWLQVSQTGTKAWLLRYMRDGRARQMGLGSADAVPLKRAREKAKEARGLLADDVDPIDARKENRVKQRLAEARSISFKECCERYIAAAEVGWRNEKHREQWKSTLANYAYPIIGDLPVADIDTPLVLKVLEPIWSLKPETAGRVRGRIERVLDWAKVREYRQGENPARWRGHLKGALPLLPKGKRVQHHPALHYGELPRFLAELCDRDGVSARALEFLILTATRTGEAIGARWDEIDFSESTWTVSSARMKAGKEHRVPLSERAIEVLEKLPREDVDDFVFIGARGGQGLSNMAMLELLHGMRPGLTVHGFRSTFRDWCAEKTNYQNHIVEMALAHTIGDAVEKAYRRGDLFDKRRRLMADWARYCSTAKSGADALRVVALRSAGS
jgi:integrase